MDIIMREVLQRCIGRSIDALARYNATIWLSDFWKSVIDHYSSNFYT